jgi:hypothetical protein
MSQPIKGVYLEEPRIEGVNADGATVSYDGVTRIERRDENYGDHGLSWFDVFKGDVLFKSFNARAVAAVHHFTEACTGCGCMLSIHELKQLHPAALSCCPERKMEPISKEPQP